MDNRLKKLKAQREKNVKYKTDEDKLAQLDEEIKDYKKEFGEDALVVLECDTITPNYQKRTLRVVDNLSLKIKQEGLDIQTINQYQIIYFLTNLFKDLGFTYKQFSEQITQFDLIVVDMWLEFSGGKEIVVNFMKD